MVLSKSIGKKGEIFQDSLRASWGNIYAINFKIENISKFIQSDDTVLDIGCGNGYSTFFYLEKQPRYISGIDYAKNMIYLARKSAKKLGVEDKVDFQTGGIRKLDYADCTFNISLTTKVLINLPTWEEQRQGIHESIRVTKMGG